MNRVIKIAFALGIAVAGSTSANPAVFLSWEDYPGSVNRSRSSGSPATAVVTAIGFDRPIKGIDIRVTLGSSYSSLPDAWRYDEGGCAAGGFHTPETSASPATPFLTGTNLLRVSQVKYENGSERFTYANMHDATPINPAQRYTIAKFEFAHDATFEGPGVRPDSCGCVEQPLCLHITYASYLDESGIEIPFWIQQEYVTWEDPNNTLSCPVSCDLCTDPPPIPPNPCNDAPTPAMARTWGQLKAVYR